MNGAPASLARRREISVLPTPVGPIIKMFLGITSSRSFSSSCSRRQRLRKAIATARLASFWPMMKRSSSETISRGEKVLMSLNSTLPLPNGLERMQQHDHVERQIVPDEIADTEFEDEGEGHDHPYREPSRHDKPQHHGQCVRHRIDDAVAIIVERDRAGAVAVDDERAVFQQLPAALYDDGKSQPE